MHRGFIKLYRKTVESWLWEQKPFSPGQAFIDLILSANHKTKKFPFNGKMVKVERGSFITSEVKLMDRWGWSKSKLRRFLSALVDDEKICKKTDSKKTTLTICNYETYQEVKTNKEPPENHQGTDKELPRDTNKNVKNNKNEKKKIYGEYKHVRLTGAEYSKLKEMFNGSHGSKIRNLDEYIERTGKKYKNHYLTILTWERKNRPISAMVITNKQESTEDYYKRIAQNQ